MKKSRRIEITAVRRRIIINGNARATPLGEQPPQKHDDRPWNPVADLLIIEPTDLIHSQPQPPPSAETSRPIGVAPAKRLDLQPRKFSLKVRQAWGAWIKHLAKRLGLS